MQWSRYHPEWITALLIGIVWFVYARDNPYLMDSSPLHRIIIHLSIQVVYAAAIVMVIGAGNKNLKACIILGAIAYSSVNFVETWELLFDAYRAVFDRDVIIFTEMVITLALNGIILFGALIYIGKDSNAAPLIRISIEICLIIEAVYIMRTYRTFQDIGMMVELYAPMIPTYLQIVFVDILLHTKEVRLQTPLFRIRTSFRRIEASVFYQGLTVERSVVDRIKDLDGSNLWCDRYEFMLNSFEPGDYKGVMVRGDGHIHVTITHKDDTSALNGYRFNLAGVMLDTGDIYTCDTVRLYDEDGFFVQLIVSEEYIDRGRRKTVKEYIMNRS